MDGRKKETNKHSCENVFYVFVSLKYTFYVVLLFCVFSVVKISTYMYKINMMHFFLAFPIFLFPSVTFSSIHRLHGGRAGTH